MCRRHETLSIVMAVLVAVTLTCLIYGYDALHIGGPQAYACAQAAKRYTMLMATTHGDEGAIVRRAQRAATVLCGPFRPGRSRNSTVP